MSRGHIVSLLAVAAALLLAASASANGGRPPVFPPHHPGIVVNVTCGEELTTSTVLSGDLDCSGTDTNAVTVDKGVKFDLGGHTLMVHSGRVGVYSAASGATVTDGTITGGTYGVEIQDAQNDSVTKMTISNSSSGNIYFDYIGLGTISANTLTGPATGAYLYYGMKNTFTGNTISNVGASDEGLYTYYEVADTISKNNVTVSNPTGTSAIEDEYSDMNVYTGNTTTGGEWGFYIYCDDYGTVTMTGNTANNAHDDNFYTYECYEDYTYTLRHSVFSSNHAIDSTSGNGWYSDFDLGSVWSGNTANGNDADGFEVDYPQGYVMKSNSATGNTSAGFYFTDNYSLYNVASFTANTANNNQDYGFDGAYFVVLGAGNKAKLNTPYDCYNTTCPAGSSFASSTNP